MHIRDYIANISNIIEQCPFISTYHIHIENRGILFAYLCGQLNFIDGSILDFKEFVESRSQGIVKYKYGYNYRKGDLIFFRYDNALDNKARNLKTYPHHKHIGDEIIESNAPDMKAVLDEVVSYFYGSTDN